VPIRSPSSVSQTFAARVSDPNFQTVALLPLDLEHGYPVERAFYRVNDRSDRAP